MQGYSQRFDMHPGMPSMQGSSPLRQEEKISGREGLYSCKLSIPEIYVNKRDYDKV